MATTNFIQSQDMVVLNEDMLVYVSKNLPAGSEPPEFGQTITAVAAAAMGDTFVEVEPLAEGIPSGKTLNFSGGETVTLSAAAKEGATTLLVAELAAGIASGETATTDGIEQTVTLTGAVSIGDKSIAVDPLSAEVEKGRVIAFSPSGVEVFVRAKAAAGADSILIEPAKSAIPSGETADLKNFVEVYSLNQADDSRDANVLSDRNFKSGIWTPKKVTSRNATVSLSGFFIRNDFGLERLNQASLQIANPSYFILLEPEGGKQYKGWCYVGSQSNTRQVDQHKNISVTLEVDGPLLEANYARS